MDLPGSNYLIGLASICITFVSVASIAFVFRQAVGPGVSKLESQLIRSFLRTGLGLTLFSLLPLLLGLLGMAPALVWRVSSVALALAHLNGLISYHRARAQARQVASLTVYYSMIGISSVVIIGLLVNAIGIGVQPAVGLFALGAMWVLTTSMATFIAALHIFLEPLEKRE